MICPRCQSECSDNTEFCHVCGNKLSTVRAKASVSAQNFENDATTLLEDDSPVNVQQGGDETTLLEETPPAPTVQPQPNNPQAQTTDYRYNPKQENSIKEKIAVIAVVAIVAIIVIYLLLS